MALITEVTQPQPHPVPASPQLQALIPHCQAEGTIGPGAALTLQTVCVWKMVYPSASLWCGHCDRHKTWEALQLRWHLA